MPNESGATVGRIVAIIELQRGTFTADAAAAERQLQGLSQQAKRTSESITSSSSSYARATSSVQGLTDSTGRLRATQLSLSAAQSRLNVVTAGASAVQDKLRVAQTALNAEQAKRTALMTSGVATTADMIAADNAVAAAQERYNAAMVAGQASAGRLASSEASLIRAQERLATFRPPADPGGMTRMRTAAMGALETFGKLGVSLGAFALAMKGIEEIKAGAEFQRQMLMIQTNANASTQEVKTMSAAILGMAGSVGTGPNELATSLYHVEQNGLRGAKALDVVKIAAQGAQVGNADLEATTNSMTAAVASGIPGVQNMSQAMGALITIVGTGDMKMSDLNDALGSGLLAVSKGYGLSLQDVGAALAVFGDNNIRGADAATALRQTIMAFAKPAASAKKGFGEIHLSLDALREDMATGGLNKAVQDLNSHMVAAGVTGTKVGGFLTEAFGKKAGVGLAVLMGQIDRFNTKNEEMAKGANSFADKWAASTHTAQFAFRQLSAEVEAAGATLYAKLQPGLYAVGKFLGDNLPSAVASTQRALRPLEQEIGTILVPALKVTGAVLGTAARLLGDVGSVAARHTGTIQVLGTVVGGMWLAWKGYTVVSTAVKAVSVGLSIIRASVASTSASVAANGGIGAALASSLSPATLALGGIGIALGVAAYAWQKHAAAVAESKQEVADFTAAIQQDSGALGDNTKSLAANKLEKSGALAAASKMGISLSDLTDASLGNASATQRVTQQLQAYVATGHGSATTALKVTNAFASTSSSVDKATDSYQRQQAALGKNTTVTSEQAAANAILSKSVTWVADSGGDLIQVEDDAGNTIDATTTSLQKQKTAADLLKDAWDNLSGIAVGVEQTQNAFLDSIDSVTASIKNNGKTLDQNTTAGRQNREAILQSVQAAKDHAQAIANQVAATGGMTAGLNAGNAALLNDERAIRRAAEAAHLSTAETDKLVASLGQIGQVHPVATPKVDPKPANAGIDALNRRLNSMTGTIPIHASIDAAIAQINAVTQYAANQTAIVHVATVYQGGKATTGQQVTDSGPVKKKADGGYITGPGSGTSDSINARLSNGEFVVNAAQTAKHRPLLEALNTPGFAAGGAVGKAKPIPKPTGLSVIGAGGSAFAISSYIRGQIPSVATAIRDMSKAVNEAFKLNGVINQIAGVKADLTNTLKSAADLRSSVTDNLQQATGVTGYGDVKDLIATLQNRTATNNQFSGQLSKLSGEGLNKTLLSQFATAGPSDALTSLTAGASRSDIANLNKAYGSFISSTSSAGSIAANDVYGARIKADQAAVSKLTAEASKDRAALLALGRAVVAQTHRPLTVSIGNKDFLKTIEASGALQALVDDLNRKLAYR